MCSYQFTIEKIFRKYFKLFYDFSNAGDKTNEVFYLVLFLLCTYESKFLCLYFFVYVYFCE